MYDAASQVTNTELKYEYFPVVPIDPVENQKWRIDLKNKCLNDERKQEGILEMCRDDSLFWLSSFCWLYEPRPTPKIIPFIPWPHQLPAWKSIERCIGYCDVGLEKSRGEGASWMIVMLVLHRFLFLPMFAAGLVSKDERTVDDPENPDSLFWKMTWQLEKLTRLDGPELHAVEDESHARQYR